MGIQVSSMRAQRYGEALVRSGIVGKIREVHTFSNKSWGDEGPLAVSGRSSAGAARSGTSGWGSAVRGRSSAARIIPASGGGAWALERARSATWAVISTVRRIARWR